MCPEKRASARPDVEDPDRSRRTFLKHAVAAGSGLAAGSRLAGAARAAAAKVDLQLPVRYYQIAQMHGPGMPPSGREGLLNPEFETDYERCVRSRSVEEIWSHEYDTTQ